MADRVEAVRAELGVSINDEELAVQLDERDELREFRDKFVIPPARPDLEEGDGAGTGDRCTYLCGNSLGLQPKTTKSYINQELDDWAKFAVEGHWKSRRPWLTTDEFTYKMMAEVVGAKPEEVAVMNSLTVNLHLLMVPFYRPTATRHKIIIESRAFPSDLYAVGSQIKMHGHDPEESLIELSPREGEHTLRTEDVIARIKQEGESLALVMLSGIQYYTGQFFEIEKITAAGHENGSVVGFDLAHAVGNVPLKLHDWGVDFAAWCSYKFQYLNSGPGGIGGCFVHERHADNDYPQFAGWWGHHLPTRFDMDEPFHPIPGAFRYRLSNPPVFQNAALLASLEIFHDASMERLRHKSEMLTAYLEKLIESEIPEGAITVLTPRDPAQRGCQLSLFFNGEGVVKSVQEKLLEEGGICDVRKPNVIRAAPVPLYNTFQDVRKFVNVLKSVLSSL